MTTQSPIEQAYREGVMDGYMHQRSFHDERNREKVWHASKAKSFDTTHVTIPIESLQSSVQVGCLDGGCIWQKPKGMCTNGGCECERTLVRHLKATRYTLGQALQFVRAIRTVRDALAAALEGK